jgi:hypothetical protein
MSSKYDLIMHCGNDYFTGGECYEMLLTATLSRK